MTQLRLTPDNGGILDNLLAVQAAYKLQSRSELHKLHGRENTVGMFDKEKQLTKAVADGDVPEVFRVVDGEYLGTVKSAKFGDNAKARVTVQTDNGRSTFVVFGVMAEQVGRMESDDLPQECRIGKDGRANVLEPVT